MEKKPSFLHSSVWSVVSLITGRAVLEQYVMFSDSQVFGVTSLTGARSQRNIVSSCNHAFAFQTSEILKVKRLNINKSAAATELPNMVAV